MSPIPPDSSDITRLLRAWSGGDEAAGERLLPVVYSALKDIARRGLHAHASSVTLQATELVNEAYIRLARQNATDWQDRDHFFAIAACVVRRILLDAARQRLASCRDRRLEDAIEDVPESELADSALSTARANELLDLDVALTAFAVECPRQARLVELRYFAGMSIEETARALDISVATAKRDWQYARAWLFDRLNPGATRD